MLILFGSVRIICRDIVSVFGHIGTIFGYFGLYSDTSGPYSDVVEQIWTIRGHVGPYSDIFGAFLDICGHSDHIRTISATQGGIEQLGKGKTNLSVALDFLDHIGITFGHVRAILPHKLAVSS